MSVETAPAPTTPVSYEHVTADREAILTELLDGKANFVYAQDSGLLDMFEHDPEAGEDAVVHILAGDYIPGTTIPRGYHHGPSGEKLWPWVTVETEDTGNAAASMAGDKGITADGKKKLQPVTRVLESDRPTYPMEPSHEYVVIGGLKKTALRKDPQTGEKTPFVAKNSMFPKEYDGLGVLQAIRIARENLINPDAPIPPEDGKPGYIVEGRVPLIDGQSTMTIRMAIDRKTGKIRTAQPKLPKGGKPIMGLTEEQMWGHVMTPTPHPDDK